MAGKIYVTAYVGLDHLSRITERVVREVQVFLAAEYGIPVEVNIVEVPLSGEEAWDSGVPAVLVEDKVVSSGDAPLVSDIVDAVFDKIREEHGILGAGLPIIPGLEAEAY